ncbi:MAG: CoA ester lyase, partial [Gammaproteobacteria bacterium]|nr:CoA ester lyase [Gammaproteobacteria bacterium]
PLPLWIMSETARGLLDADDVYGCSRQIAGVIMGTSDLARELRIPHTPGREGLLHLLSHCVVAARAHGLEIIDGVHLNFRDLDEFQAHCVQGRTLGFDGKSLIHPSQISVCNQVFSPSDTEIEQAREIIQAWQTALQNGEGVCVVNGRLVENLHVDEARRTLELAEAIGNLAL